ncbi:hypothetical protein [Candidatus Chlamydia corallus]|uniref:hypothetical protein n=1 Tax=Candidatus Chlamydia corallus TaxID=2038470 RepID=UPI000C2F870F
MIDSVTQPSLPESQPLPSSPEATTCLDGYITQPDSIPATPWETFRSKLSTKQRLCFVLTLLVTLAGTLLASCAAFQGNWIIFGIGLAVILITLILALLLAIPIKNKQTSTKLIDEMSQDISSIGSGFAKRYGSMFSIIKETHIPELVTQKNSEKEKILNQIEEKKEANSKLKIDIALCQNKLEKKKEKSLIKGLKNLSKKR